MPSRGAAGKFRPYREATRTRRVSAVVNVAEDRIDRSRLQLGSFERIDGSSVLRAPLHNLDPETPLLRSGVAELSLAVARQQGAVPFAARAAGAPRLQTRPADRRGRLRTRRSGHDGRQPAH